MLVLELEELATRAEQHNGAGEHEHVAGQLSVKNNAIRVLAIAIGTRTTCKWATKSISKDNFANRERQNCASTFSVTVSYRHMAKTNRSNAINCR